MKTKKYEQLLPSQQAVNLEISVLYYWLIFNGIFAGVNYSGVKFMGIFPLV